MIKQILLSAITMASLQAAPTGPTKDQLKIINEAYDVLHKYKEVTKLQSIGPVEIKKLATRKFREEDHGMLKPRSLESWALPVEDETTEPFYLIFDVEVLDLPDLGFTPAHSEFVHIFNIKLYPRLVGYREVDSIKPKAPVEVVLKDKKQPEFTKRELTLISRKIAALEKKYKKTFTAAEKLKHEKILRAVILKKKKHQPDETLKTAKGKIIRKKK